MTRRFRGAEYRITVDNPDGVCRGVKSLMLNGSPVEGNVVPVRPEGSVNEVRVTLG